MKCIISWGRHIYRSDSLAVKLHFEKNVYIFFARKLYIFEKPLRYIYSFLYTLAFVFTKRPHLIILVGPPTLIFYCTIPVKFFLQNTKVYLDLHNGVLRREWKYLPFLKYAVKKADYVICHNKNIKPKIDLNFVIDSYVLSDPLMPNCQNFEIDKTRYSAKVLNIIVPCSFSDDEPTEYLCELAHSLYELDDVLIKVTGNYHKKKHLFKTEINKDVFTGYLTKSAYTKLLKKSDIVLCLTSDDDIQMAAVNEAISYCKVFFHSGTKTLTEMYGSLNFSLTGDVKTDIRLILEARNNLQHYQSKIISFKDQYDHEWVEAAKNLRLFD